MKWYIKYLILATVGLSSFYLGRFLTFWLVGSQFIATMNAVLLELIALLVVFHILDRHKAKKKNKMLD